MLKKITGLALAVIMVAALYLLFGCPIRLFTGISCPGCGMTRAWLCLLGLDVQGAFYYHPLWFVPPVFAAAYMYRKRTGGWRAAFCTALIYVAIFTFAAVYLLRLYAGDPVLDFNIRNGLIYKILSRIAKLIVITAG